MPPRAPPPLARQGNAVPPGSWGTEKACSLAKAPHNAACAPHELPEAGRQLPREDRRAEHGYHAKHPAGTHEDMEGLTAMTGG